MIFNLNQLRTLVENNIITEEKYTSLINYFNNYVYDRNSLSEEDKKFIQIENKKGNYDVFSDKDLLSAKRSSIITSDDFINIYASLKTKNESKLNNDSDNIIFNQQDLSLAQKEGVITNETYEKLLVFLKNVKRKNIAVSKDENITQESKYSLENFLYYFGGFIVIIAMAWFMANIATAIGRGGMFVVSSIYFGIFVFFAQMLWEKNKKTAGGILYTCAVSLVPLIVYSFECMIGIMDNKEYSDFHILIRSCWIFMEIATIVVGVLFIKKREFPLLTLPICWSAWYLSMDIVPLLVGRFDEPTWEMRKFASFIFAIILLFFANKFDRKNKTNFSHWFYIFGATMLWGVLVSVLGLNFDNKGLGEFGEFLLAACGLIYMIASVIMQRKVFMIWGVFGVYGYIGHLGYAIFKDSPIFPIILALFGLSIVFFGVYFAKNCDKLEENLRKLILGK